MNNSFIIYLFESSICMLFFYLIYQLFLKKETYFNINRTYLVLSILISLTIPSIKIKAELPAETVSTVYKAMEVIASPVQTTKHLVAEKVESNIDIYFILMIIYFTGIAALLVKLIYQLLRLFMFIRKGEIVVMKRHYMICTNGQYPTSSFFNYILWDNTVALSDAEVNHVIKHEMAHINQFHTLDNLLMEIMGIIFWFNPLIYFYNKELKQVHEYIADNEVLNSTAYTKDDYEVLINKQILNNIGFQLSNNFNMSNLKTRLMMISKPKSRKAALLKLLAVFPVLVLMILVFSIKFSRLTAQNSLITKPSTDTIINEGTYILNMRITGRQEGKISIEKLLEADGIQLNSEKYTIGKFDMTTQIEGQFLFTYSSADDGLTADMRRVIKKLHTGDKIYFENVEGYAKDGYNSGPFLKFPGTTIIIENMPRINAVSSPSTTAGSVSVAEDPTIETFVLDGIYNGKNIYVSNPYNSEGNGFTVQRVLINGASTTSEINSSAFEVDLIKLTKGEKVKLEIQYKKGGQKPRIINPEAIAIKITE